MKTNAFFLLFSVVLATIIHAQPGYCQSSTENQIDLSLLQLIKGHYVQSGDKFTESLSDSILTLSIKVFDDEGEDMASNYDNIDIPLRSKTKILIGDLNNDSKDDYVVSIFREAPGGNVTWNDVFLFLYNGNKYVLSSVTDSHDISGCTGGNLQISRIENGFLIGNSLCYSDGDARCCPSLKYLTKLKLDHDKFVFVSKSKVK